MNRLCYSLLLLAWSSCFAALAAEPPAIVRAKLEHQGDIWVGQRVTLVVDLLAPGTFASAPAFDLPQVSGIVIVPPSGSPVLGTETIDDTSYTTQRHELIVFTQRAGELKIPAFTTRFDSSPAFGKPATSQSVTTPPLDFTAKMPPGAEGLAVVITTSNLTVKQTWTPELGKDPLKLGAALTRTITTQAENIPAMLLPAYPATAPQGLAEYPHASTVKDQENRGTMSGYRIDTVTYVCQASGEYQLPSMVLAWWDPEEEKLHRVELAGQTFVVAAVLVANKNSTEASPLPSNYITPPYVLMAVVVLLFGVGWYSYRGRRVPPDPEAVRFREFEYACAGGDARKILSTLYAWLDEVAPADEVITSADLAVQAGDHVLNNQLAALEAVEYSQPVSNSSWSASQLLQRVRLARLHVDQSKAAKNLNPPLPALNP